MTTKTYTYGIDHGIDFDARYSITRWPGVAFYLNGWVQTWEPYTTLIVDEDGEEYEEPTDEGEWIDDPDHRQVRAVMVGDDREHIVDVEDLTIINDYCSECGQIDCQGDFRNA